MKDFTSFPQSLGTKTGQITLGISVINRDKAIVAELVFSICLVMAAGPAGVIYGN